MTTEMLEARIREVEAEVAQIKDQLKQLNHAEWPKSRADFYGILAGQVGSADADLEAVKLRMNWNKFEDLSQ